MNRPPVPTFNYGRDTLLSPPACVSLRRRLSFSLPSLSRPWATSIYSECPVETALATLRDLALPLIKCEKPFGSIDSWPGLSSLLDQSMVVPRVIIAADPVGSDVWAAAVSSALAEILIIPSTMDELLHLLR